MKKIVFILLAVLFTSQTMSQWISNYWGNNTGDDRILNSKGLAAATDNDGNCYVTGYTMNSATEYDIILIKYNSVGDTIYSRIYSGSGTGQDRAFGIAVDEEDNIYLAGQVYMDGLGLQSVVLKYNSDGELVWDETYGATNSNLDDASLAIALNGQNKIFVTGYCTGTDAQKDILILKYSSNGTLDWAKQKDGNGTLNCEGFGIAVDSDNSIYVAGYVTSPNNTYGKDIAVLKYLSNGIEKWLATYNGSGNSDDVAYGIAIDRTNKIYITGYTSTSVYGTDAILMKLNPGGNTSWIETYNEGGQLASDKAFGIAVEEDNSIYITGETTNLSQGRNYLTLKYNSGGERIWNSVYNGPGNGDDYASAIGLLSGTRVVVTGASWGTNNNFDYATVRLNKSNGNVYSVSRYSLSGSSSDIATDLVVSQESSVFVTGYSELIVDSEETTTVISTLMIRDTDNEDIQKPSGTVPEKFGLYQNYPNPFNPSTTIKFDIPDGFVRLVIYDILGNTVDVLVNNELKAGSYSVNYTNKNLSSGIYFYELSSGNQKDVKKMSLIK